MKTDLYTKAILTVIAIGLIWIAANMTLPAGAQPDVMQVDIVKIDGRGIGPFCTPVPVKLMDK